MFVQSLLPQARARLVTLEEGSPLTRAAHLLRAGTDILAICSAKLVLVGVITKTDVVKQIAECDGGGCLRLAALAMTQDVIVCRSEDTVVDLWARMRERGLKNVPYVDGNSNPIGMLNARDLLQALLKESTDEESLMRDYVMGVGYR